MTLAPQVPADTHTCLCIHQSPNAYLVCLACVPFHPEDPVLWPFLKMPVKASKGAERQLLFPPHPHPHGVLHSVVYVIVRGPRLCLWSQHTHGQFCHLQNVSSDMYGKKLSAWPGLDADTMATVRTVSTSPQSRTRFRFLLVQNQGTGLVGMAECLCKTPVKWVWEAASD